MSVKFSKFTSIYNFYFYFRTLACPIGRGMLTLGTLDPIMAEALPIPPLSLSGRVAPSNTIMTLDTSINSDLTQWPEFHNGVAAALRIGSSSTSCNYDLNSYLHKSNKKITRNWIIYNRTASLSSNGGESSHAGIFCFISSSKYIFDYFQTLILVFFSSEYIIYPLIFRVFVWTGTSRPSFHLKYV